MTSTVAASELAHKLNFLGGDGNPRPQQRALRFLVDFDSSIAWPDLPYDTASAQARYPEEARPMLERTLASTDSLFRRRASRAWDFIDEHLDRAMVRRSGAIETPSSSSNRELVGVCLLTNLHLAEEPVSVCAEALVHETIHQYLYRTELRSGSFCDLADGGRYRSPWSGNRIPLHSLVHASLVWFGLLTLWCQLAGRFESEAEAAIVRTRVAPTLFGFAFIGQVMSRPAFPRGAVHPAVIALIDQLAQVAAASSVTRDSRLTLAESLQSFEAGDWIPHLAASIERIQPPENAHSSCA